MIRPIRERFNPLAICVGFKSRVDPSSRAAGDVINSVDVSQPPRDQPLFKYLQISFTHF
jgi:hypothetical protein